MSRNPHRGRTMDDPPIIHHSYKKRGEIVHKLIINKLSLTSHNVYVHLY